METGLPRGDSTVTNAARRQEIGIGQQICCAGATNQL